ncbi:MAG TPA: hypothetical protein VI542_18715 [Candidatus Tectomicrobia bacterium]
MHRGWVLGLTLYMAFFAITIGLRWRQVDQPYTDFTWITAHSQLIVDNWLESGVWNERGLSFLNPPSIEFPSLLSRQPYVSYPCGAQWPVYILAKVLDRPVTPGVFHIWGLVWHGCIGLCLIGGLWLFDAKGQEPERSLGTFLPGFVWLGGRASLTYFPAMWYADIVVLLPFVLVGLVEVIMARALLRERYRRWLTWSLPGLIFWGTYTDWLFVPLCAVIFLYRLLRLRSISATFSTFVWQVAMPAAVAVMLFLLQLGWTLGPHFGPALLERFLVRSLDTAGAFARHESLLWYVYGHFVDAMGVLTIALTALALLLLCVRPGTIPGPLKDFLCLLLVPSILLLLIFRQHAAVHQFVIVKFMIPVSLLLGGVLPRVLRFPYKQRVLAVLCAVFLAHEGWRYWTSLDTPVDQRELALAEAVRSGFGYHDVLFTLESGIEIPEVPPGQLARSRKRIYQFDAERVAQLRTAIPEARMFLISTTGASDTRCPEKQALPPSFYYCRL